MADDAAVSTHGLAKSYGGEPVLGGLDLSVPRGSVYALLGPNGAGKTTTVRILATLSRPDAGTATVAGFDVVAQPGEVRRRIGLTGQFPAVDALQTGEENLRMVARLAGLPRHAAAARAQQLLREMGLEDVARRRAGTYSGGMRRRLDLAAALLTRPEVLFLDEPSTGLDPASRIALWDAIDGLVRAGTTILLTTQQLDEADRLAHRIGVLDRGGLVAEGTAAELKARVAAARLELTLADGLAFARASRTLGERVLHSEPGGRRLAVASDGHAAAVRELLDEIDPAREHVVRFAVRDATLDDAFLALTGDAARA